MNAMKYIMVAFVIERDGDYFVATCRELGVSSSGDTRDEAIANIREATELYLDTYEELGECEAMLRKAGVEVHAGESASHSVRCKPSEDVHAAVFPLAAAVA